MVIFKVFSQDPVLPVLQIGSRCQIDIVNVNLIMFLLFSILSRLSLCCNCFQCGGLITDYSLLESCEADPRVPLTSLPYPVNCHPLGVCTLLALYFAPYCSFSAQIFCHICATSILNTIDKDILSSSKVFPGRLISPFDGGGPDRGPPIIYPDSRCLTGTNPLSLASH